MAVSRLKRSLLRHCETRIETIGPNSTTGLALISHKKTPIAESAAWRISRFESESMLKRPSRKSGSQSSMLMSGTLSSTVIHPTSSWRMYGLERRMYFWSSGMKRSTSNDSDSVTMSLMSRSSRFAPFFTSMSTSANSLQSPSKIWLK